MIREEEKAGLREKFATDIYYDGLAIRWKSSGNVVPEDIMDFWFVEGLVTADEVTISNRARMQDLEETMRRYRKAQANRTEEAKAEEAYELRAAFGEGETVIDLLTGEVKIT